MVIEYEIDRCKNMMSNMKNTTLSDALKDRIDIL